VASDDTPQAQLGVFYIVHAVEALPTPNYDITVNDPACCYTSLWTPPLTSVSQTLLITTYPSLTFVSLLPNPGYAPTLRILTTLSGPPSTTTSTSSLIQCITTSILPRTSAFLNRLKRERHTLEESRHLRDEQDKAFKLAESRKREKRKRSMRN
jgi:hypothetical protein